MGKIIDYLWAGLTIVIDIRLAFYLIECLMHGYGVTAFIAFVISTVITVICALILKSNKKNKYVAWILLFGIFLMIIFGLIFIWGCLLYSPVKGGKILILLSVITLIPRMLKNIIK